jgi:hypothetical protein
MNSVVFWDVTPCSFCKTRRFGGTYRLHQQDDENVRAKTNISSNQKPKDAAKNSMFLLNVGSYKSHAA